ncbi:uncharacterized protein SAPINGB_P003593 [Magnusiomyces paraingens]|uniref:Replication factor A protein 3 n=1 Tax=Magnusiomyces paraingens TaxID=2606893 RepID=A0A5E8BVJ2_9ASCO|nr:uncharacterized protein SAPINGB_P003593 [Saprochaete ingens]VVT53477.1 unnamed protein product [Saprochaete ingens]
MSSSENTPRITAATRQAFKLSTVRIVGKLENVISSNKGQFEADGLFQGTLPDLDRVNWRVGSCYELIGQVQNDLEIKVLSAIDMGTNPAIIPIFNELAAVSHRFPEVFQD